MTFIGSHRGKASAAFAALLTLAACATTPPVSPQAGPASVSTSPELAGRLFAEVCLANLADLNNAKPVMAQAGFVQNSVTSTYYLPTENLSIKLLDSANAANGVLSFDLPAQPDTCSLVFVTDVPTDMAVRQSAQGTFATGIPIPPNIDVTSRPAGDGRRSFNMRITAQ